MEKSKVKELIEGYKRDGFHQVDIELKDKNCIQINKDNSVVFSDRFLTISNSGYLFHIIYSFIEEISI